MFDIIFRGRNEDIYSQLKTTKEDFNIYLAIYPDTIEDAKSHYRDKDQSRVSVIDKMLSVIHDPSLTADCHKSEEYVAVKYDVVIRQGSVINIIKVAYPHSKRNDPVVQLSCEELLYAYQTLNGLLFDYILSRPNFSEEIEKFVNSIYA